MENLQKDDISVFHLDSVFYDRLTLELNNQYLQDDPKPEPEDPNATLDPPSNPITAIGL